MSNWWCYLLLLFSTPVFAEFDWRDPTQPARYFFGDQINADSDLEPDIDTLGLTEVPAPETIADANTLRLRQILVSPQRRLAKINEHLVYEGDEIAGYIVTQILPAQVKLQNNEEVISLKFFEKSIKTYKD